MATVQVTLLVRVIQTLTAILMQILMLILMRVLARIRKKIVAVMVKARAIALVLVMMIVAVLIGHREVSRWTLKVSATYMYIYTHISTGTTFPCSHVMQVAKKDLHTLVAWELQRCLCASSEVMEVITWNYILSEPRGVNQDTRYLGWLSCASRISDPFSEVQAVHNLFVALGLGTWQATQLHVSGFCSCLLASVHQGNRWRRPPRVLSARCPLWSHRWRTPDTMLMD